jgi:hypothetical protein
MQCTVIIRNECFIVSLNMAYLAAYSSGYRLRMIYSCCVHGRDKWDPALGTSTNKLMTYFRLPPRCKGDVRSFEILRRVEWHFITDVSGQPIGPTFKGGR